MKSKKLTINNFISYSRCKTLFHYLKEKPYSIENDPELVPLLQHFCNTFKDIYVDKSFGKLTKKDILKRQKNIIQPLAFLLPELEYNNFIFRPHILYIDHTSIDVYILSPAHYVSRYFTYILGLWKFGFDNIGLPVSRYLSISIKNKSKISDSFFNLKFESNRINNTQQIIRKQYDIIQDIFEHDDQPYVAMGKQCFKPSKCDHFKTCWKIQSPNIFDLVEFSFMKKLDYYNQNISSFIDVKNKVDALSDRQNIQINAELSKQPYIDKVSLTKFFNKLTSPIQCLDIEVITNTLPIIDDFKTFEKIPFLFSLHTFNSFDQEIFHTDFFTSIGPHTLRAFAEALIQSLKKNATIIVYDSMLENIIFDQLCVSCPDLTTDLKQLKNNIIDISYLFKSFKVYIPGMLGKFSLKAIHGSINPTNNHQLLELKSGSEALNNIKSYIQSDRITQQKLEKELRDYCKMDTLALVEILFFLKSHL
tara:strand:+ start:6167 stop:7597 length:1431 start_codon:yes stop_codon:yes gene_type:complete